MTDSTHDFFDTLAKILLRCWIFGFLLLLLWFGMYMLAGDLIYSLHGNMFGLASCSEPKESYLTATVNLEQVRQARKNSRNLQQRRPELYGEIVKPVR